MPPLNIKLGLMKNFVKAMVRNGTAFLYLREKFPLLSDTKIGEGVFTGPDIHSLLRYEVFERIIRVMSREHGMPSERWLQAS